MTNVEILAALQEEAAAVTPEGIKVKVVYETCTGPQTLHHIIWRYGDDEVGSEWAAEVICTRKFGRAGVKKVVAHARDRLIRSMFRATPGVNKNKEIA